MRIYTRTGDRGDTGLWGGGRVAKDHARVAAYGEVDELNAVLGLVRAEDPGEPLDAVLADVQRDLFALGACLANPSGKPSARHDKAAVGDEQVRRLEQAIDEADGELPPLDAFILPGGARTGALLHLARTVCRRAERAVVTLARAEPLDDVLLAYLNRLSDLLFVLARRENLLHGRPEERW